MYEGVPYRNFKSIMQEYKSGPIILIVEIIWKGERKRIRLPQLTVSCNSIRASPSFAIGQIDVPSAINETTAGKYSSLFYCTSPRPSKGGPWFPTFAFSIIPQMSLHYLNLRFFLAISVALLGPILLFLRFSRTSPSPFNRSADGPFSSGGDSLQHVSNHTLGVSMTDI